MNDADKIRFHKSRENTRVMANGNVERRIHVSAHTPLPVESTEADRRILAMAGKYAAMSTARVYALVKAAQYVVKAALPGPAVVCGVGLGGSALALARAFRNAGECDRPIWLYDTFDSETRPELDDYKASQAYIAEVLAKRCPQYDQSAFRFIPGMVENTIPGTIPDRIALMHLDTDWYASTLHELVHLWPLLITGGVVLIDDYGCWESCRRAVDEYLEEHDINILLSAVDYTGRIGVKV